MTSPSPSSSSCSHWWHAPIYIAATASLILAAISSSYAPVTAPSSPGSDPIPPDLILALHRSGFHLSALLLQISSVHVSLSPSSNLTIFVLPDRHLSSLQDLPSALLLLRRHVVPTRLPFESLSRLPRDTCVPTLLADVTLRVTSPASLEGVAVTHPDLFLSPSHAVHAVGSRFDQQPRHSDPCHVSSIKKISTIDWDRIVRALRSSGYVSFSEALSTNLESLRGGFSQVTVFAPRDSGFENVSQVRRHVAKGRYSYAELAAMRDEEVGTAEEEWSVRVTSGDGSVEVNGVEVVEPEVYVEENVVVHGIPKNMD